MQVYDIQISSANDVERINAQGDYIYYSYGAAGGSNPCVEVRGINTGFRVKLLPGQGMRLPMGKVERDWMIKPDASIAGSLIGAVVIGEGEIFDNRVTGSVEVIEGGRSRTISNTAFWGFGFKGPQVGNFCGIQLWNPVNSGRRAIVEQFCANSTTAQAGFFRIGFVNTSKDSPDLFGVSSKKSGGSSSVMQMKAYQSTSTNLNSWFFEIYAANWNDMKLISPKEPLVIEPGWGMVVENISPNTACNAQFEFYEEPI